MISTLTDTWHLQPEPSAESPPFMLMEVPWLSKGALLERGLGMPTCKHDLSLCRRQDFKINLARGACPSSPYSLLREGAMGPRAGEGQYRVWGRLADWASMLGRSLSGPTAGAPPCRGHGEHFMSSLHPPRSSWTQRGTSGERTYIEPSCSHAAETHPHVIFSRMVRGAL